MATVDIKLGNNTINGVDTIKVTDATDNTNKIDFIYGVTPSGSVNIKLGNNTITGVNTLSVLGADTTYKSFGYAEPVNLPSKGDIINIDMTGSGTPQQFRVLKINGNIVEVVGMSDANSSIQFDSNGTNTYTGKTLDNWLNGTYYDTFTSTAKSAIVDKTFTQDSWYRNTTGNPDYNGKHTSGDYQLSLGSATYGAEITRHVYALSVQDIIDYLEVTPEMTASNTTLTYTNIFKMFWNDEQTHSEQYLWLRSAHASNSIGAFNVNGGNGNLSYDSANSNNRARAALTIDLSKIEWTPET